MTENVGTDYLREGFHEFVVIEMVPCMRVVILNILVCFLLLGTGKSEIVGEWIIGRKTSCFGNAFDLIYDQDQIVVSWVNAVDGTVITAKKSNESEVDLNVVRRLNVDEFDCDFSLALYRSKENGHGVSLVAEDNLVLLNGLREFKYELGGVNVARFINYNRLDSSFILWVREGGDSPEGYFWVKAGEENTVTRFNLLEGAVALGEWGGQSAIVKHRDNAEKYLSVHFIDPETKDVSEQVGDGISVDRGRSMYPVRIVGAASCILWVGQEGIKIARKNDGGWVERAVVKEEYFEGMRALSQRTFDVVVSEEEWFLIYQEGNRLFLQQWNVDGSRFKEFYLGEFGVSGINGVKLAVSGDGDFYTLTKEGIDERGSVDLVLRKWNMKEMSSIRSGRFEDLIELSK